MDNNPANQKLPYPLFFQKFSYRQNTNSESSDSESSLSTIHEEHPEDHLEERIDEKPETTESLEETRAFFQKIFDFRGVDGVEVPQIVLDEVDDDGEIVECDPPPSPIGNCYHLMDNEDRHDGQIGTSSV